MTRVAADSVTKVTCIGTGTIGAGWAAYFLAQGMEVVATDPAPDAEEKVRALVAAAWPTLRRLGMADGASQDKLGFEADLAAALEGTEFVQESAPDREDLKIELFSQIDALVPEHIVIASSSSQFIPTRIASACQHPQRCIIGHPFAPSYLLPLVEVVGGEHTDADVLQWAMSFYDAIGKHALLLRTEIEGYISNRLQQVVSKEIHELVEKGVCSYEEADRALVYGPGFRWAFAGPLLCSHLAGGRGGIEASIAHWGWGGPADQQQVAVDEVAALAGHLDMDTLEAWRDDNLLALMKGLKPLPGGDS